MEGASPAGMQLGVDVGGTFTDAVLVGPGSVHSAKVPTTPDDQSQGVMTAVERVLAEAEAEAEAVAAFSHGMTVGTNALLERRGARTALLATAGFTDLLEIARQARPSLYRLCEALPPPLADPDLRVGVRERVGPDGVEQPLGDAEIERVLKRLRELRPEAVAICLLFAYREPEHERRLAAAIREALPEVAVSASHEVLATFREYERCSTTVIDAYLAPLLGRYLHELGARARAGGLPEPEVMRSSGGVASLKEAAGGASWSVLSGPAGGAVGAGAMAALAGAEEALGFDMGGTSCDVCVIEGGAVRRTRTRTIGARPLQLPMVDIETVGAGGGSIAWIDAGGALRVGPRSAGADPGPACYGRGGSEPTVTDANLLLGHLADGSRLAGGIVLDRAAAEEAVARVAEQAGMGPTELAEGIIRITNGEMVRALRVLTVERGVDPRRFALLAFGGAGGMHACGVAGELGIGRVLLPRTAGVLSALGLVAGERRRDVARTVSLRGDEVGSDALASHLEAMREQAATGLAPDHELEVVYEMRYVGQGHELEIDGDLEPDSAALVRDFSAAHESRYGYRDEEGEVELIGIRLAAVERRPRPELPEAPAAAPDRSSRRARSDGEWTQWEVLAGSPGPGQALAGPCVLELAETTLVVPAGWTGQVDRWGTIELRCEGESR